MREPASTTRSRSTRLNDALTVVQALIKQPVREAVREAFEEERQRDDEAVSVRVREGPDEQAGDEQSSSARPSMSRGRKALGLLLVLAGLSYLVRRRDRVLDATPVGDHLSRSTDETDTASAGHETVEKTEDSETEPGITAEED